MLTAADIVFLVDESATEQNTNSQDWFGSTIEELNSSLAAASIDVRYGLVGFGEGTGTTVRYAHSQLLGAGSDLFTASSNELSSAIANDLSENGEGATEDGWDALEHAIAEYDFRTNAVPILIVVQGDEGRRDVNRASSWADQHRRVDRTTQSEKSPLGPESRRPKYVLAEAPEPQTTQPEGQKQSIGQISRPYGGFSQ